MKKKSVLITGAAGDIGIGMSKILKDISWIENVHGVDINGQFPTSIYLDGFSKVPRVDHPNYIECIEKIVKENKIELIIPTSEYELRFFCRNSICEINDAPLLMAGFDVMAIGFDKLKTVEVLKEKGYQYPWTVCTEEGNPIEFPCILKSRDGSGSKEIKTLKNAEYKLSESEKRNWVFQEFLSTEEQEYTAGVFKSRQGNIETITFRRMLSGGRTGYGEVVRNQEIEQFLFQLACELEFVGSINIQFRMTDRGPVTFEINPRFSSTLVFRHKLGFKDVEWSILDMYGKLENINFNKEVINGKKIFRADMEIIY